MIRRLFAAALILTLLFCAAGLAISPEWGWDEYASDELWIVFQKPVYSSFPTNYLVSLQGDLLLELKLGENFISNSACSQDGNIYAFIAGGEIHILSNTPFSHRQLSIEDVITNRALTQENLRLVDLAVGNNGLLVISHNSQNFPITLWAVDPFTNQITQHDLIGRYFSHVLPSGEDIIFAQSAPDATLYVGLNSGEFARRALDNWYQTGEITGHIMNIVNRYDNVSGQVYLRDLFHFLDFPTYLLIGGAGGEVTWSPDRRMAVHAYGNRGGYSGDDWEDGLYLYRWNSLRSVQLVSLLLDLGEYPSGSYDPCFLTFRPDELFDRIS